MGFLAHFFVGVDRTRQIADLIEPTLNEMGFELVRVLVTGGQRPTLQIMVDRADLAPLTVAHCAEASHAISALLDVADPIVGARDVASAAVEEARGAIVVMIHLTPEAATRVEATTAKNVGRRLAVVVGDEVLMSPVIQGAIKGDKLPLGIGKVEEAATAKPEAEAVLATILRAKG